MANGLYSLDIRLRPERPAVLPATCGHQAHAAFLEAIRKYAPDLADLLHTPRRRPRPFTVSPLLGMAGRREGEFAVSPERDYSLRVTLLDERLYVELMGRFLEEGRPALRLGEVTFLIAQVLVSPGSSPWAGYTNWEALAAAGADSSVTLEFLTPTAFHLGQRPWGKRFHLFPEPLLVFRSLLRAWNGLCPASLAMEPASLEAYLKEDVIVQEMAGLRTVMWRYPRHLQIGFVGRVTYGFPGDERSLQQRLCALADFAFYAGVGYKTTMGMGQTRRVPECSRRAASAGRKRGGKARSGQQLLC
ncbi:MAG: CRISPR-associated endoribonuclease Cas6 [Chloroflexia bacterium]